MCVGVAVAVAVGVGVGVGVLVADSGLVMLIDSAEVAVLFDVSESVNVAGVFTETFATTFSFCALGCFAKSHPTLPLSVAPAAMGQVVRQAMPSAGSLFLITASDTEPRSSTESVKSRQLLFTTS